MRSHDLWRFLMFMHAYQQNFFKKIFPGGLISVPSCITNTTTQLQSLSSTPLLSLDSFHCRVAPGQRVYCTISSTLFNALRRLHWKGSRGLYNRPAGQVQWDAEKSRGYGRVAPGQRVYCTIPSVLLRMALCPHCLHLANSESFFQRSKRFSLLFLSSIQYLLFGIMLDIIIVILW